jgi:GNAT superfamily N-acetyltransferase
MTPSAANSPIPNPYLPRLASEADIPALEELIPLSVHELQVSCYSQDQREAALGPVFGVDRQLIRDGTYFVIEDGDSIVACGGWSRRKSEFGGDRCRAGEDGMIDPLHDPARVRAFFVHPQWARRGLGSVIMRACEESICAAGFRRAMLVATLPGEPLYARFGYRVEARYEVTLREGLTLPVVRMSKEFT